MLRTPIFCAFMTATIALAFNADANAEDTDEVPTSYWSKKRNIPSILPLDRLRPGKMELTATVGFNSAVPLLGLDARRFLSKNLALGARGAWLPIDGDDLPQFRLDGFAEGYTTYTAIRGKVAILEEVVWRYDIYTILGVGALWHARDDDRSAAFGANTGLGLRTNIQGDFLAFFEWQYRPAIFFRRDPRISASVWTIGLTHRFGDLPHE